MNECPYCGGDRNEERPTWLHEIFKKHPIQYQSPNPGGRVINLAGVGDIQLGDQCNRCDHLTIKKAVHPNPPTAAEVIAFAKELAEKFIRKCDVGLARSHETQTDCRTLIRMIGEYEEGDENTDPLPEFVVCAHCGYDRITTRRRTAQGTIICPRCCNSQ